MHADIHGKGVCGTWPSTTGNSHLYNSRAPDDGHNGARNMLQTKFCNKNQSVASSWPFTSTF